MARLEITGAVTRATVLDFAALRALDGQIEDASSVVPGRNGSAVRLAEAIALAAPLDANAEVLMTSGDGAFSATVPLSALSEALLLYREGDAPLPAGRGGPIRLLIPGTPDCGAASVDACANVKDLARIEIRPESP
ncbi:MAG: molybdopterin-dependent oxidoreductase [Planctomycetota bacterium]